METRKGKIIQLSITAILLAVCFTIEWFFGKEHGNNLIPNWGILLIYLVPYIFISFDIFKEMFEAFKEKEIFNEEFLMLIATLGALAIGFIPNSKNMFAEAVLVLELFQLGELLEDIATSKSEKSISSLINLRPNYANVVINNNIIKTLAKDVKIGSIILVKPGESVPLDGIIIEGKTHINTVSITGESVPRSYEKGKEVLSSFINLDSPIYVKTTKAFKDTTINKIIDLVKNSNEHKSKTTRFISSFAKYYTPIVILVALILGLVGSLVTKEYAKWITIALTSLVISCPCALVISVPLCFFVSIGLCAKKGILIKGANSLEQLSNIKTLVFDKTGTLTKSNFKVIEFYSKGNNNKMIGLAKGLELNSNHPIAKAIIEYKPKIKGLKANKVKEIPGYGLKGIIGKTEYFLGNEKLMKKLKVNLIKPKNLGSVVYVANSKEVIGYFVVADEIKKDSFKALKMFKQQNIKTIMLSGDLNPIVENIGKQLNIDEYYGQLLPEDKINKLEQLIKQRNKNELVAFAGDGINDSPSIARADIGISMGAIGSSSAIEASDIVLMEDKLSKISDGMKISKKAKKISKQNIVFALCVKLGVLVAAIFGFAPMWLAILADVGVTILSILNATRCAKINNK